MSSIDKQAETFTSGVFGVLGGGVLGIFKNDLITLLAEKSTLATETFYKKHPLLDEALEMNSFLFAMGSGLIIFLLSKYGIQGNLNDLSHIAPDSDDGGDDGGD